MPAPTRITIPMADAAIARLKSLSAKLDVSHAKLVTALVSLPDEDIERVVAAHVSSLALSKTAQAAKDRALRMRRKELLDALGALSEVQLDNVLSTVQEKATHVD